MAITQKFYPKFFMNAILGSSNLNSAGDLSTAVTIPCTARLHTAPGGAWDPADNITSDLTAVTTQSDGTSLANPTPLVSVTFSWLGGSSDARVEFSVPSMQWTNPSTFRYVTIATTTGNFLLMHLDIGTNVTSGGTVTLTMTSGEEPALQFTF